MRLQIVTGGDLQPPMTERTYEGELVTFMQDASGKALIALQCESQSQPILFTVGPWLAVKQVD